MAKEEHAAAWLLWTGKTRSLPCVNNFFGNVGIGFGEFWVRWVGWIIKGRKILVIIQSWLCTSVPAKFKAVSATGISEELHVDRLIAINRTWNIFSSWKYDLQRFNAWVELDCDHELKRWSFESVLHKKETLPMLKKTQAILCTLQELKGQLVELIHGEVAEFNYLLTCRAWKSYQYLAPTGLGRIHHRTVNTRTMPTAIGE